MAALGSTSESGVKTLVLVQSLFGLPAWQPAGISSKVNLEKGGNEGHLLLFCVQPLVCIETRDAVMFDHLPALKRVTLWFCYSDRRTCFINAYLLPRVPLRNSFHCWFHFI